jgi:tetratricopeptide (TPR) repeat protein
MEILMFYMNLRAGNSMPFSPPKSRGLPAAGLALALLLAMPAAARAAGDTVRDRLKSCLDKADTLPDVARADADAWLKLGGGDAALLCRATASFHAGAFAASAEDFARLAATRKDSNRAALLHAQAGLAFMRAAAYAKSEAEYAEALKLENQDPDIWVDRAVERAADQRYWDALADLNAALKIMPGMVDALRLRGDVWVKLGMKQKAEEDFRRIAEIEAADKAAAVKTPANSSFPPHEKDSRSGAK